MRLFDITPFQGKVIPTRYRLSGAQGVAHSRCILDATAPDADLWAFVQKLADIDHDLSKEDS